MSHQSDAPSFPAPASPTDGPPAKRPRCPGNTAQLPSPDEIATASVEALTEHCRRHGIQTVSTMTAQSLREKLMNLAAESGGCTSSTLPVESNLSEESTRPPETALSSLLDSLAAMKEEMVLIRPKDEQSESRQQSVISKIEGMILGVGLAFETLKKEDALRPPKRQDSACGHRSYAQAASANLESQGAVHKSKKSSQLAREKSQKETFKEKALEQLRSDNPTKMDPERRLILELEMEEKRKEHLSKVNFMREANEIVSHLLKIENALEWVSRLERGGFLVQASVDFIQALELIPDFKLQLESMGTWIVLKKDQSPTSNGSAIVVEGVDLGLEPADVVYELAHRNHSVTGMNHGELMNIHGLPTLSAQGPQDSRHVQHKIREDCGI